MADNVTANAGSGGATFAGASLSFSGDTAVVPIGSGGILSGSEGSWTFTLYVGGAGAVTAGTPRVTLASDDPAVAALGAVADAAATQGSTGSISAKLRTVTSQLNTGNTSLSSIDGKVTACNTGAVVVSSGTLTAVTTVGTVTNVVHVDDNSSSLTVDNGGTFAVQAAQSGTWNIGTVTPGSGATNLGKAEDAAHSSGDIGVMGLAVRQDTAAALGTTDGDYLPLITDSTGRLWCNVSNTVTVASHAVTNAGTFAVQVDGSALTALQKIDDPVLVDDAAFTPATSSVMMAGFEADESSTDSVDEGDAGAARMTLDRKQIATVQPHTAGGATIFRSLDLDETEEDIKTSAGQLYGFYAFNASTSIRYLKFYNATAANTTVGSTTPVLTIPIPAATSGGVGMVFAPCSAQGIPFDTAICAAATTGLADADTGAPAANDVILNAFYK